VLPWSDADRLLGGLPSNVDLAVYDGEGEFPAEGGRANFYVPPYMKPDYTLEFMEFMPELRVVQTLTAGVDNVLALRGDPPQEQAEFVKPTDGFGHANELMTFIRERDLPFCLGGACYPEAHLESDGLEDDLAHTRAKVEAGAEFLITQLFFDNAFYFHFVERARKAGITCPIVPGLMPITNIAQIERITRMCGATMPMRLRLALEKRKDDPEAVLQLGVAHATLQAADLLANGAPGVHFYTLNRSRASRMIVTALQVNTVRQ
jgi:methylenetetrahydrofolate reductase (NADPH)